MRLYPGSSETIVWEWLRELAAELDRTRKDDAGADLRVAVDILVEKMTDLEEGWTYQ